MDTLSRRDASAADLLDAAAAAAEEDGAIADADEWCGVVDSGLDTGFDMDTDNSHYHQPHPHQADLEDHHLSIQLAEIKAKLRKALAEK